MGLQSFCGGAEKNEGSTRLCDGPGSGRYRTGGGYTEALNQLKSVKTAKGPRALLLFCLDPPPDKGMDRKSAEKPRHCATETLHKWVYFPVFIAEIAEQVRFLCTNTILKPFRA
jgi:hypothetical protein